MYDNDDHNGRNPKFNSSIGFFMDLGWHTFIEGIKKGTDKLGITSKIENATGSGTEIANTSSDIFSNSLE